MITVFAAFLFYVLYVGIVIRNRRRQQIQAQEIVVRRRRQMHQDY